MFTTDMNPAMAPAGIVSDGCITVPRVTDSGYIEMLLTICKEKRNSDYCADYRYRVAGFGGKIRNCFRRMG